MPQPALPEVPGERARKMAGCALGRTAAVPYFHDVFTLPHELSALVLQNKRQLYDLLCRTSATTMLELARDPKHLGADIGFLGVLHTWGQNLEHHPHVHYIVPATGLALDDSRWIDSSRGFFLPVHALSRVFRSKFCDQLRELFQQDRLQFYGSLEQLASRGGFNHSSAWAKAPSTSISSERGAKQESSLANRSIPWHSMGAVRATATAFGVYAGILGVEHGCFETLQGNVAPKALKILAVSPFELPFPFGHEPAMTIVPSFLVTGILAILVGLAIILWSVASLQSRAGAGILFLPSVLLLLVGGGFGPISLLLAACVDATRINQPSTGGRAFLPAVLRRDRACRVCASSEPGGVATGRKPERQMQADRPEQPSEPSFPASKR